MSDSETLMFATGQKARGRDRPEYESPAALGFLNLQF
jgi:hypothetical protein